MPVVIYSLLRLGVFLLALLGLWLAGMGSWLLVVVAAVVAAALSYVVFGRQRTAAAAWIADRRSTAEQGPRFSRAVQDDADAEDAVAEQLHSPADGIGGTDGAHAADGTEGTDQIASPRPSSTP